MSQLLSAVELHCEWAAKARERATEHLKERRYDDAVRNIIIYHEHILAAQLWKQLEHAVI